MDASGALLRRPGGLAAVYLTVKKPLLLAFFAGTTLVVGIRQLYPDTAGAVAAAVTAAIVVLALGLYYWKSESEARRRDRAGDDLYYLGLLLTLVSLIYALVSLFVFSPEAGDVQARVDTLIGNFGIALISTVAGILGRILLQDSAGETPPGDSGGNEGGGNENASGNGGAGEQEALLTAEMREAIANMMQLRQDLRKAADAFAHFTRVTLSHAHHVKSHTQELLEGFNQHMAAVAERGVDDTGAVWRKVGEAMREDGEGLLRSIEAAASGAAERTEETWRGLVGQIESASLAARSRLDADAEEMGRMLQRLGTANGSLETLANALGGAQGHVSALAETASSAAASLKANATETLAAQRVLAEGAKASQVAAMQSFEVATAALTDAVDKQVAEQSLAWQRAVDEFDAAGQAHREQGEQAMAATQRAVDVLIASLETARQDISTLGRAASGAAAAAESRTAEILATLSTLSEGAKEQQEASLRAWHEAASNFSKDAREHLAREMDAWREAVDVTVAGRAQRQWTEDNLKETQRLQERVSAETSRLANLVERLDGLLETVRNLKPFDRKP